ncbi:MAG: phosphopentomutase [Colwellia sp.]|jgi:phosphopentomutase
MSRAIILVIDGFGLGHAPDDINFLIKVAVNTRQVEVVNQ